MVANALVYAARTPRLYCATMSFEVVCISRTDGARGEAVAQLVAERLGYQYIDDQIIARAAELAKVDPAVIAATEQRQSLLDRLIAKLVVAQEAIGPMALDTFPVGVGASGITLGGQTATDDLRSLIRAAIHEVAKLGRVVIVSHASSMALAFVEGVLRVLVTASAVTRARRVGASAGMSEADATAAIAEADRNRQDYFRRFYEIREEQSTHYDLVINTDVLSAEQAASLVVFAARGQS